MILSFFSERWFWSYWKLDDTIFDLFWVIIVYSLAGYVILYLKYVHKICTLSGMCIL
jgi:hypothetical protein